MKPWSWRSFLDIYAPILIMALIFAGWVGYLVWCIITGTTPHVR